MRGVILDLHDTLVTARSLPEWLADAGADAPTTARVQPVLAQVWQRAALRRPHAEWDLDPALHRQVFLDVLVQEAGCPAGLAQRLYETMADQWVAVPGAIELLQGLRARSVRTALLSNIAIDPRPRLEELGLLKHLDAVVLSHEEGRTKPDPELFRLTAARLGLEPGHCVMVGDSPASDGGAAAAGMASIIVPVVNGLPRLDLVTQLLVS